jgi:SAM-dependent methyltransferase
MADCGWPGGLYICGMYPFAVAIFVSAFLLFLVQPLMGRFILPWYGGAPAAWTVTLLFFQTALLAGYTYAHLLTRLKNVRAQAGIHAGLVLVAAVVSLPIIPAEWLKPSGEANPALSILLLLTLTVGLPFLALAATGPLLQAWLARVRHGKPPWIMYALSNVGSLGALLAYPFVLEPILGRGSLALLWSGGFILFVLLSAFCAYLSIRPPPEKPPETAPRKVAHGPPATEPTVLTRGVWVLLAACGVWMLMATTNKMTLDIAPVPFLWVLPLSLYLFSFVVTFAGPQFYQRYLGMGVLPITLAGFLLGPELSDGIMARVFVLSLSLFGLCWVLHGELYRLRPPVSRLTSYYLLLSLGGAIGGLVVGLIAPFTIPMFWEYEIGLILATIGMFAALAVDENSILKGLKPRWAWGLIAVVFAIWLQGLGSSMRSQLTGTLDHSRTFFGVMRVIDEPVRGTRSLRHGNISHGRQYTDESRRNEAISYYSRTSGVGRVLRDERENKRIGMIGLGVGTVAAYGKPGDVVRFYEIDPEVEVLARRHFWYLEDAEAEVEIIIGDGRMSLEREEPQEFDVLAVDAFSSGSIPVHLLTLEAFAEYMRHLKPDGVLAIHISNNFVNLLPVCAAAADRLGLVWTWIDDAGATDEEHGGTDWVLFAREPERLEPYQGEFMPPVRPVLWTDDYSNIFRLLR